MGNPPPKMVLGLEGMQCTDKHISFELQQDMAHSGPRGEKKHMAQQQTLHDSEVRSLCSWRRLGSCQREEMRTGGGQTAYMGLDGSPQQLLQNQAVLRGIRHVGVLSPNSCDTDKQDPRQVGSPHCRDVQERECVVSIFQIQLDECVKDICADER